MLSHAKAPTVASPPLPSMMALQAAAAASTTCSSSFLPGILLPPIKGFQFRPFFTISCISRNPFPSPNPTGCRALILPIKLRHCVSRTLAGNAVLAPDDMKEEDSLSSEPIDSGAPEGKAESAKQNNDVGRIDNNEMIRICDRLIEVFLVDKPTPSDWRKLLVFSKSWSGLRSHFFSRCKERADTENDPGMKQKLLRLGRKLKDIDEDVERHFQLLEAVSAAPSEIHEIVRRRRKDFTTEFFQHVRCVAESYYEDPDGRDIIIDLGKQCILAVEAHDMSSGNMDASLKLQLGDVVNSPRLDAAGGKIDFLAEKSRMDSATMELATKAFASTKETSITKSEVMDMTFESYKKALRSMEWQLPKEVRILRRLLRIKDPERMLASLTDAFTPGEETDGGSYTTPQKMYDWIESLLHIFNTFRAAGSQARETKAFMDPVAIQKLLELKKLLEDNFL